MKIVVIGGTGLIGSKVVANLRRGGHEVDANKTPRRNIKDRPCLNDISVWVPPEIPGTS